MNIKLFIIISLTISTTFSANCGPGCIVCVGYARCIRCAHSILSSDRRTCESLPARGFDHCVETDKFRKCDRCEPGWAINTETGACIPGTIEGCNWEKFTPGKGTICRTCIDARVATNDLQSCTNEKYPEPCHEGGPRRGSLGILNGGCYYCGPNYVSILGKCKPVNERLNGCIYSMTGRDCIFCDYLEGFYMTKFAGACVRQ